MNGISIKYHTYKSDSMKFIKVTHEFNIFNHKFGKYLQHFQLTIIFNKTVYIAFIAIIHFSHLQKWLEMCITPLAFTKKSKMNQAKTVSKNENRKAKISYITILGHAALQFSEYDDRVAKVYQVLTVTKSCLGSYYFRKPRANVERQKLV